MRWRSLLFWSVAVALMLWLPRGLALDRFVTADEHAWLTRSGNFYRAISQGDFGETFQRHHPGVTVTWAGTLGFLSHYPAYAQEAPKEFGWLTEEIEPFLRGQGHAPIDLLAAGRSFVVLFITVALLLSFWMTVQLLDLRSALIGVGLIAFAPFHVGLSRLMHLDGLLSSFMLLSLLGYLLFMQTERRLVLGLSAVAAGLSWLTRSPGFFLGPFIGVLVLARLYQRETKKQIIHFAGWVVVGLLTFVLLWPAMWVAPLHSLGEIFNAARNYASEGHLKPIFFNGQVFSGDPGINFYPISYLWRSTPITLIGLVLGLFGLVVTAVRRKSSVPGNQQRFVLLTLLLFSILFGLFMNLGDKKFDRYLLPAYLPLTIVAGWGWAWLIGLIDETIEPRLAPLRARRAGAFDKLRRRLGENGERRGGMAGIALGSLLILAQAGFSLPTVPYYLSFYNPLMGGSADAPKVMQIGWGEGADQAAALLNDALAAEGVESSTVRVASAYTNGPFSYFFDGTTLPIYFWHQAEYAVVYAQDFQRRLPGPRQIRYFEEAVPLDSVGINGLTYARIYGLKDAPLPSYVTEWQVTDADIDPAEAQIRLVSYLFPSSQIAPGEALPMTLYFENLAPIGADLSVLVRLTAADGTEIARSEGWPQGRPTSTWTLGDTWADGHSLAIPADAAPGTYRLDVSFYDSGTLERLSASRPLTGELLGDTLHLDFVQIGATAVAPARPLETPAEFDGLVALTGTTWQDAGGAMLESDSAQPIVVNASQGEPLTLELYWDVMNHTARNYTTFVHVIGPDGVPLTQRDEPPWSGFYPTPFWSRGRTIAQPLLLEIPDDAPAGDYAVHVGMYDSETVTRLPITRNGEPAGDAVVVATLRVQE